MTRCGDELKTVRATAAILVATLLATGVATAAPVARDAPPVREAAMPASPDRPDASEPSEMPDNEGTEGAASDSAREGRNDGIEEIIVSGVRMGRLADNPSTLGSSIRTSDFEGERTSLADLLSQQVGVQLRRFGGPGERTEVSIRGSATSQVAVLLDGVALNSTLTGGADLSQICLGLVESVEVARGGGSVQEGSGAIGGVVDIATRRPGEEPVNRVSLTGGAFGTWEATAHRSGRAKDLEYSLGYCGFTTDGDYRFARPVIEAEGATARHAPAVIKRINNERIRHSASVGLGHDLGRNGHLRIRDYLSYTSHGEPGLDPACCESGGQNPDAHGRGTQNLAHLDWSSTDHGWLGSEIDLSLFHRYQQNQFRDPPSGEHDSLVNTTTRISSFGFTGSDVWAASWLRADHRLKLRFDAGRDSLYADERPDRGRSQVGLMLQEDARFFDERLVIVPAIRVDWTEGFGEVWLPSLGAVLKPYSWLKIRGNIERSYRAPSFDDLYFPDKGFIRGNPDLAAEAARNADVGIEFALQEAGPIRDVRLSAGFFQNDVDDSIVWMAISPRVVRPENTGPARIRGFEISLALSVTEYLRIFVNHTELDTESLNTGLPLAGRADSETNLRAELGEQETWKLITEMQRTGMIPVSASGRLRLPDRTVWNLSASLNLASISATGLDRWLSKAWVFVDINNVGDVAVRDALFFPQPGRNAHAGMEVQW